MVEDLISNQEIVTRHAEMNDNSQRILQYVIDRSYYECRDCGSWTTTDHTSASCPDCGGQVRNIGVTRE